MKTLVIAALALVSVTSVVGCSKPSGDPSASSSAGGSGGGPAGTGAAKQQDPGKNAAGPKVITLAKFGLKGTAPGETEDPIVGTGDPAMVMAAQFTVNVSEAKPTDPKTLKDGQSAAKLFNPKNEKTETLADGWALTYENTGSMGTNYFVSVRREIGGKGYMCETMQSTTDQQAKSLAFCKSLTK